MSNNFNHASTLRAVEYAKVIPTSFLRLVKWISFLAAAVSGAVWLAYSYKWAYRLFRVYFPAVPLRINILPIEAAVCISLALWLLCAVILAFESQKLKRPGLRLSKDDRGNENLLEYFNFEAARIFRKTLAHPHFPFEKSLLYQILASGDLSFTLERLGVKRLDLQKKLMREMKTRLKSFSRADEENLAAANAEARRIVLEKAREISIANGLRKITIYALFLALADRDADFQGLMDVLGLLKEDVESAVLWQMNRQNYQANRKKFWERDNLRLQLGESPARAMIGGYTATLDRYARDLSLANPLRQGGVVLHTDEIERMEAVLTKQKESGALLVGEAGCGRKSIVYNFANRVFTESGPRALQKMRIMELNLQKLAGDCRDKTILASAIDRIFFEAAAAKNVVLVIPEIHNYLGAHFNSEKLVQMDIGDILGNYLEMAGFRVIGITTHEGLHRSIELAGDVSGKLAKIEVAPVTAGDAMRVLKEEGLRREGKAGLFIPLASLKEIVRLGDYFSQDAAFPEKAIDLLDDLIASRTGNSKTFKKLIAVEDVAGFFSRKYAVPAGAAGLAEKDILLNLEDRIHEGLINQKEAVAEIANAMRRARAEIKRQKRTIGNFLFLGPTGVGKTETAKQLARVYFGSVKNMIRLNMAEYQTVEAIEKLIGNERTPGFLTAAVRQSPFSLLLIDEIEKADKRVLDIFLSIFDEGRIVDGLGREIDFRHILIIATSNAGAEAIRQAVAAGRSLAEMKNQIVNDLLTQGVFKPEFINRFDAVAMYRPLNRTEVEQVAQLLLAEVQSGLREKRIEFLVTPQLCFALAQAGFDPEFGGRAMRRAVQDKVENALARGLLAGAINPGDTVEIDPANWEILTAKRAND